MQRVTLKEQSQFDCKYWMQDTGGIPLPVPWTVPAFTRPLAQKIFDFLRSSEAQFTRK